MKKQPAPKSKSQKGKKTVQISLIKSSAVLIDHPRKKSRYPLLFIYAKNSALMRKENEAVFFYENTSRSAQFVLVTFLHQIRMGSISFETNRPFDRLMNVSSPDKLFEEKVLTS